MWSKIACLAGKHDWSERKALDPDDPSIQIRTCARCHHEKFDNAAAPLTRGDIGAGSFQPPTGMV